MKVAVVGAGNAGCATAADMASRGIDVTLIKTSKSMHDDNFEAIINNGNRITLIDPIENGMNKVKECNISNVTRDFSVISEMELIMVYVQTTYHEELIKKILPHMKDGQVLLLNPGYFSTAYVLKNCGDKDIVIAEAQSSFIDGRIVEPGVFKASFRNVRNPIGVYPINKLSYAKDKLNQLGFPLVYLTNVVEAALHNPNMIVHTVGALLSIPMIDTLKNDFCMYHKAFTEHVWNIVEKLDSEKMNVLEKLGCKRLSYVEACKFRNSLDDEKDAKAVFFEYALMPNQLMGPGSLEDRFITEDVPQGLVMLETLGKALNVETPVCTALIEIGSAALMRDMRENGRTLEKLGLQQIKVILEDACNDLNI